MGRFHHLYAKAARKFSAALVLFALLLPLVPAVPASAAPAGFALPAASPRDEAPPEDASAGGAPAESASPAEAAPPAQDWAGLYAPEVQPNAAAVCLMAADSDLVLYERNADTPMAAASLVKLMTAILTVENVPDLDNTFVTAEGSWVFDALYGKNASNADIRKGETLSVRELLYAMLLPSGNEAALLLGDFVSTGYMTNFLYMMNVRAQKLGCTGTYFADANGLSEESVTTARDMCKIMRAFMQYPVLLEIASTQVYEIAAHEKHEAAYNIFNTNRLLAETSPYYSAFPNSAGCVVAGKTGSLGEWQSFVSYAANGEAAYVCAMLQSPNEADALGATLDPPQARPALYETARLYDWAFTSFVFRPVLDTAEPITELRVRYSTQHDTVQLIPTAQLSAFLPKDTRDDMLEHTFHLPDSVAAPVKKGDILGRVDVTVKSTGQLLGSAELAAAYDVARDPTLYAVQRAQEAVSSLFARVLVVVTLVTAGIYALLIYAAYADAKKKKARARAAQAAGSGGARRGHIVPAPHDAPTQRPRSHTGQHRPPPVRRG